MIWLKCNREELEPRLLSLPHVGYIASDRGFGVRISRTNLKAAWASLKPGIAFEEPVEIKLLFKLSALPPATTAEGLRVLATETGWNMRPLKRINASTWLIGASKPFKSDYICVEGATILIKSVQPHGSRHRGAILASTGTRPDMPPAGSRGLWPTNCKLKISKLSHWRKKFPTYLPTCPVDLMLSIRSFPRGSTINRPSRRLTCSPCLTR